MRRAARTVAVGLLAVLLVLLGVQFLLQFRLNSILRKYAIPQCERSLGVPVNIGGASVNLFRGSLSVSGGRIGNPTEFVEPTFFSFERLFMRIGLLRLLRGNLDVADVRLSKSVLVIARNPGGAVNVVKIQEGAAPATPPAAEAGPAPASPALPAEPARVLIRNLAIETAAEYVDHAAGGEPLRLAFDLTLRAADIATFERPGKPWGSFVLRGHLKDDPQACVTEIKGRIAPLVDPAKPTLELDGTVRAIRPGELRPKGAKTSIESDSMEIQVRLKCEGGTFDSKTSVVRVKLVNPRLSGKLGDQARGVPLPAELVVTVPVSGSLDKPVFDFEAALLRTAIENLSGTVDAILRSATSGSGSEKDLGGPLRKLGDLFKSKP